jgi:hypothetical protein
MLCPRCDEGSEGVGGKGARASASGQRIGRLSLLYCERCGSPVAPPSETDTLLDKLAQLARFGLSAANAPLLGSRSGGGEGWRAAPDEP